MAECKWCTFDDPVLIIKEYKYWGFSLAESQFLIGWCHAYLKRHILHFEELTADELIELKQIVRDWKVMLNNKFQPDWFNVMQCGNMTKHLHFQLVPRYESIREFNNRIFKDDTYGRLVPDRWEPESNEFLLNLKKYLLN